MKKAAATVLYLFGVLITLILLVAFLLRADYVLNPDAMLPTELWEQSSEWLAIGSLPMWISSLCFVRVISGKTQYKRTKKVIIFTPAIICTCFLFFWIGVWGVGFFRAFFVR